MQFFSPVPITVTDTYCGHNSQASITTALACDDNTNESLQCHLQGCRSSMSTHLTIFKSSTGPKALQSCSNNSMTTIAARFLPSSLRTLCNLEILSPQQEAAQSRSLFSRIKKVTNVSNSQKLRITYQDKTETSLPCDLRAGALNLHLSRIQTLKWDPIATGLSTMRLLYRCAVTLDQSSASFSSIPRHSPLDNTGLITTYLSSRSEIY